jgi:hypothetical protein
MGRGNRDRKRSRSRERKRSRSPERKRDRAKDTKKEKKDAPKKKEEVTAVDPEEQKKLERQEAWKKAKLTMLREAAVTEVAPEPESAVPAVVASVGSTAAISQTLAALSPAPAQPVMKNVFADEDEAVKVVADPSRIMFDSSSLPVVAATAEDEEEDEEDNKDTAAAGAGDEPDELDMFMTGIQAEHEKLLRNDLKGGGNKVKVASEVGDEQPDDEEEMQMLGSDDDRFLAGESASKKKMLEAVDHSAYTYAHFNKDFYIETETIKRMTDKEVKKLRKKLDHIRVRGKVCFVDLFVFSVEYSIVFFSFK